MASAVRSGGAEGGDDVALALYQTVRNNGSTTPGTAETELGLSDAEAKAGWSELRELGLL